MSVFCVCESACVCACLGHVKPISFDSDIVQVSNSKGHINLVRICYSTSAEMFNLLVPLIGILLELKMYSNELFDLLVQYF